jgi:5-methylcytosine-specific restriction enzyme A
MSSQKVRAHWSRDEIILALDLYFDPNRGSIDSRNSKVIELSATLRKLPIHTNRYNEEKFRNPNGISLKLSNFLSIDPNYPGKGMPAYSNLDKEIFFEFQNDIPQLREIAKHIRAVANDPSLKAELQEIDDDDDKGIAAKEGKVLYKLHKYRERNKKLVDDKKKQSLKKYGKLECEVCLFNFEITYGDQYIECHHCVPLSQLTSSTTTTLDDLVLVCANCHRMLHRKISSISVEELKQRLSK